MSTGGPAGHETIFTTRKENEKNGEDKCNSEQDSKRSKLDSLTAGQDGESPHGSPSKLADCTDYKNPGKL